MQGTHFCGKMKGADVVFIAKTEYCLSLAALVQEKRSLARPYTDKVWSLFRKNARKGTTFCTKFMQRTFFSMYTALKKPDRLPLRHKEYFSVHPAIPGSHSVSGTAQGSAPVLRSLCCTDRHA